MRIVPNKNKMSQKDKELRRKLLAMLHIAKKDCGYSEISYREMLTANFRVPTAAALTNQELSHAITYFKVHFDWQPKHRPKPRRKNKNQVRALKYRAIGFVSQIPGGEPRVIGLCRKLCGVDRIEWCDDLTKIKRLLAAMGNIVRKEGKQTLSTERLVM